jgi:glycosyltransferase involved in cell wall biosynthesis
MINVLYICPSSGIGGAETFILQTQSQGKSELYRNHYLLFSPGPLYDSLIKKGARVTLLKSIPRLSKIKDHKIIHSELRKIINQENIKLVHSTMAYGAIFAAWTCKQLNVPHVWFQHGPASGWMDRIAALLPHSGLIVNSHYTGKKQRELENILRFLIPRKIPIEKILLGTEVTPQIEIEVIKFKNNIHEKFALKEGTVIISMLCRLQKWKGVMLLLEAIKRLKNESLTTPFHCLIWGGAFKNEDYKKSLEDFIKQHQLPAHLMGVSQEVTLPLQTSDIIVNASLQPEPFGLSIIEGMMLGAIPVVPDEGGPIEIVSNGKNGLIFKARQADSLARNLKTLILDPTLREKLSDDAIETAQNKYSAKRAIDQLETFYSKVLNL